MGLPESLFNGRAAVGDLWRGQNNDEGEGGEEGVRSGES